MAALLGQVGGREVDDQPLGRQGEAQPREGGAHPLAALGHRLVAQAATEHGAVPGVVRRLVDVELVGVDRALDDDPCYSLALLLRGAISSGLPPSMAVLPMSPDEVAASYADRTDSGSGSDPAEPPGN